MSKSATCLVTGGAGFIGSHLCDALIVKEYEVYCLDNLITGNKKNIEHLLSNPRFHFILHDITKPFPSNFQFPISNFQFIYHLASPASPPKYQKYSIPTLMTNSLGTYLMLNLAKENRAIFILASTSEVYGDPKEHPQKESYYGNVNPVGVRACYDEAKRFAEALTMEYWRKFKTKVRIARIFNTYGPRMMVSDGRVISNFISASLCGKPLFMYGSGQQTRSFCYITDMIEGLISLAEKKGIDGKIVNLGNPDEKTIKNIGGIILQLTNSRSPLLKSQIKEDDPTRRRPDISRAEFLLQWQPQVSLEAGLQKTIAYFQAL